MKTCVSSFSFSRLIKSGKITQLDAMRRAKEMGFDAFELASVTPHDGSSVTEYAKMLRKRAEESKRFAFLFESAAALCDYLLK